MDLAQEKKYSEHLYGFTCDEPRKNHVSNWAIDDVDAESAQIHHITSHRLAFILLGVAKSPKHPIHPYGVMAVVMPIRSVMNGVVTSSHNRPQFSMNAIMNVCSPNGLNE